MKPSIFSYSSLLCDLFTIVNVSNTEKEEESKESFAMVIASVKRVGNEDIYLFLERQDQHLCQWKLRKNIYWIHCVEDNFEISICLYEPSVVLKLAGRKIRGDNFSNFLHLLNSIKEFTFYYNNSKEYIPQVNPNLFDSKKKGSVGISSKNFIVSGTINKENDELAEVVNASSHPSSLVSVSYTRKLFGYRANSYSSISDSYSELCNPFSFSFDADAHDRRLSNGFKPSLEENSKVALSPCKRKPLSYSSHRKNHSESYSERIGYSNPFNDCYINSVLQSLIHIEAFTDELMKLYLPEKFVVYNALRKLVEANLNIRHEILSANLLKAAIGRKEPKYASSMQQDAQEFLCSLFNCIEEEFASFHKETSIEEKAPIEANITNQNAQRKARESIEEISELSPVSRNFQYIIQNRIICTKCLNSTVKREIFKTFPVQVVECQENASETASDLFTERRKPKNLTEEAEKSQNEVHHKTIQKPMNMQSRPISLQALLGEAFGEYQVLKECSMCSQRKRRKLSSEEKDTTEIYERNKLPVELQLVEGANQDSNAIVRPMISSLPRVLILHLKRFKQLLSNRFLVEKSMDPVYPDKELDLGFCCDEETELPPAPFGNDLTFEDIQNPPSKSRFLYHLDSIIVHNGSSVQSGHYVSFLYEHSSQTWKRCSDELVSLEKEEIAMDTRNSYILFYLHHSCISRPLLKGRKS